jgi:hypothetical protein
MSPFNHLNIRREKKTIFVLRLLQSASRGHAYVGYACSRGKGEFCREAA